MSDFRLRHDLGEAVELRHAGRPLFRYVYAPQVPASEAPKPYFHPLSTLAGEVVTGFRPHDHRWHHGLAMTCAELSGQNFWGGPTYVRDRGYLALDNAGRQEHVGWDTMDCDPVNGPRMGERLRWTTAAGETWLEETRTLAVGPVDEANAAWSLDLEFRLTNVRGTELRWGSPTTQGRENAGYGGLFWRGPREFAFEGGGRMLAADGSEDAGIMGRRAAWLAFVGRHDGTDRCSTLVFSDHPDNARYPTSWFARQAPWTCASAAFSYSEEVIQASGETVTWRYRVVVADGEWDRARVAEMVTGC